MLEVKITFVLYGSSADQLSRLRSSGRRPPTTSESHIGHWGD